MCLHFIPFTILLPLPISFAEKGKRGRHNFKLQHSTPKSYVNKYSINSEHINAVRDRLQKKRSFSLKNLGYKIVVENAIVYIPAI